MGECSVVRGLIVEPGVRGDYEQLSGYHYREGKLGPYANIFVLRRGQKTVQSSEFKVQREKKARGTRHEARVGGEKEQVLVQSSKFKVQREKKAQCPERKKEEDANSAREQKGELVGVIVYSMPAGGVELRREALGGYFDGLGSRAAVMKFINERVRVISRVIIEPRFRGLGLAARLVRETMELVGVPIVEALAVMGQVNPFFEKAGMRAFYGQERPQAKTMREALSWAGIEEREWIDPTAVCIKINNMDADARGWLCAEMAKFLAAYGRRGREVQTKVQREETAELEMVSMVLKKLGDRPVYFVKIVKEVPSV